MGVFEMRKAGWRLVIVGTLASSALGCSREPSQQNHAVPELVPAPLQVLSSVPSLRSHLDFNAELTTLDEAFELSSRERSAAPLAFSVVASRHLSKGVRLARHQDATTWLEVQMLGMNPASHGAVERGTIVYSDAERDTDVVLSIA